MRPAAEATEMPAPSPVRGPLPARDGGVSEDRGMVGRRRGSGRDLEVEERPPKGTESQLWDCETYRPELNCLR